MDQEDEKLEGDSIAAGAMADGEVQMREQPDTGERQVHPRRFRLWGLAASPGDGCTAVVVSKYNTQHPHRRDYAEIMFGWYVANDGEEDQAAISRNTLPPRASTEARVWEWMYGRGDEVPGTTNATDIIPLASSLSTLRRQFRDVLPKMRCVFCDTRVQEKGSEAECENGHSFGKPIALPCCFSYSRAPGPRATLTMQLCLLPLKKPPVPHPAYPSWRLASLASAPSAACDVSSRPSSPRLHRNTLGVTCHWTPRQRSAVAVVASL